MIEPGILFGVFCDHCGEQMCTDKGIEVWSTKDAARAEMSSLGWQEMKNGDCYCAECLDNIIIGE